MKDVSPERWQQIEALLDEALERPLAERGAFLDEACGGDAGLRAHLQAMLAAGDDAEAFLEPNDSQALLGLLQDLHDASVPDQAVERAGMRIGPYRILKEIGRGGMGAVYLAERADGQFEQQVAVKVIRRGMDTDEILSRFRMERQILASLSHPHIARLLDGGATEDGLSYFVMEYIDGVPLTTYCDEHRLPVEARLQLFEKVCEAIHYAHQNLIVHRDLKPSNILVTEDGEVKLLDFGIAKLLDPTLPGYTVPLTRAEMRVMTPEYASPEQVRGEALTTASDVYTLGLLLYELLTGHRPYRLAGRPPAEVERVICETEPTPPSTVIRQVEERPGADGPTYITPEAVGQARGAPTERLHRLLVGDLDTIVLMALRKEPEHRYQSAEALAEDIRRFLDGMPVSAQRPTFAYRAWKFTRRHKVGVTAAALFAVLLVVVAVLSIRFAVVTAAQAERIEVEAAKSEEVKDFLIGLFEVADPAVARGEELTARELLARGAEQIERELAGQPAVQAELLNVMGVVYRQLGMYGEAEPLLERALAMRRSLFIDGHPEIAESLHEVGLLLDDRGLHERAIQNYGEALAMRRTLLGEQNLDVAATLNNLAIAYIQSGDSDEGVRLLREALTMRRALLGEEHRDVAESTINLAWVLHEQGNYDEAEALYRGALRTHRKLLSDDHPQAISTLNNLAALLYDQGKYTEAELSFREALALRRKVMGEEHPLVANSLNWVGRTVQAQGRHDEAEPLFRRTLALHRAQLGPTHPIVGRDLQMLAGLRRDQGYDAEAEQLLREALALFRDAFPEPHRYTAQTAADLGRLLLEQQRPAEAEPLLREALAFHREAYGEADPRTAELQQRIDENWAGVE